MEEDLNLFHKKECVFWNYCTDNCFGFTFSKIQKCLPCLNCYSNLNNEDGIGQRDNQYYNNTW